MTRSARLCDDARPRADVPWRWLLVSAALWAVLLLAFCASAGQWSLFG